MSAPQLYLGTSGFSFDDWRGTVYPASLPKPQWLIYYEQQLGFRALEINYTYYQMPSHRTLQSLVRKTSEHFRFSIKAHRSLTHDVLQADSSIADNPDAFRQFREGMRPLTESGKLACVLAQFPYGFRRIPAHERYLAATIERLGDLRLVVEFRHDSWAVPETYRLLRERGVGFCAVDEPPLPRLMPWVSEVTSDLGYVRCHGRNAQQWFGTSTAERYHYSYDEAELHALARRLRALSAPPKQLLVFFNNCHAGAAAKNALRFQQVLVDDGWRIRAPQTLTASLWDDPHDISHAAASRGSDRA